MRLLIHTDTFIKGEPIPAGTLVEVDEDTGARLRSRGEVVGPDFNPEGIQTGDPNPVNPDPKAESRDPKKKTGK